MPFETVKLLMVHVLWLSGQPGIGVEVGILVGVTVGVTVGNGVLVGNSGFLLGVGEEVQMVLPKSLAHP